ncbi:M81 family metallopeptidase [Oceanibaculum pacificum]|uniref:Microcystinase C n=1 Tax=Oceanibaculum pacificum TaxID=580166 RepID=A0A154VJE9_9PROT|nr:M81 family metallopeptidase [Oceanibaculum pacificum]KZD01557.1 microcystin degradation protein MlrC [Oceanibaculum pacificum]
MHFLFAMMKHETNTFSPVPTPLERFARGRGVPPEGQEAVAAYRGTQSALAAFIDIAEKEGASFDVAIAGAAWPSGPVEDKAYDYMVGKILDAAKSRKYDAIFLDLHGAMVTESHEDGEGQLLVKLRQIAPETPIAVALDMHTNLYSEIVDNATVVAGYQTYPHIDVYETGMRAGLPLMQALKGAAKPTMSWGNRPMLPHVMRQGTDDFPNKQIQQRAREMEQEGALVATLFTGFPHADIYNAGLSVVVVTDNDPALAQKYRDELLDFAWKEREAFVYKLEPLAESVSRAKGMKDGPVVLLDHFDNAASGGTMDTTAVLGEIIRQGLDNVAFFAIHDPEAVQQMIKAGIGAQMTIKLGGKIPMPLLSADAVSEPLEVTGKVRVITNGEFRNRGPMSTGILNDMGPTAVFDTGKVEIVVISRHQEPNDLNCFYSLGIDPLAKNYLCLKSRVHWGAGFKPVMTGVVECAGVGVCTSDYNQLDFKHVRRPVYPLNLINDPSAGA